MAKEEMLYMNQDKLNRAKDIVALVENKRSIRKASEVDAKTFWSEKIDAEQPKDVVRFVYEALGGLVRTHAEDARVRTAAAAKKKVAKTARR